MRPTRSPIASALIILSSALAYATATTPAKADGRGEINQTSVEAGGGFPLTLTEPGNYRLTSSLTVPANTNGIVLQTTDVTLDLNGFSIVGPAACNTSSCSAGSGSGITQFPSVAFGHYSTVRNGTVRGFAGNCVSLGTEARVTNLHVRDCGTHGILVSAGSSVTHNRVRGTGTNGIRMSTGSTYAHNSASIAGLGGGGDRAYRGGTATAGNTSDDGSTAPRGERRYYLTSNAFAANQANNSCDTGFHMASMWEILDPSRIHYDKTRGISDAGSAASAPAGISGWVWTGKPAQIIGSYPGGADCLNYSEAGSEWNGTTVRLNFTWIDFPDNPRDPNPSQWWTAEERSCNFITPVWCVED